MNTPNNAAALLPCPFCGGNAYLSDYECGKDGMPLDHRNPKCERCGVDLGYDRKDRAIAAWNRRATLAQPDALTVRIAHKGPSDFPNHQCPAESSAVWNACCMEHERVLAGKAPMLATTTLTSQPSGEAVAWMDHFGGVVSAAMKRRDPGLLYSIPLYTHPSADASGEAVDEWRPIESAPKDGSCCIVTNDVAVGEAWYSADDEGWWWANTHPTDAYDGLVYEPTRWQPLPAPPAALAPKPEGGSHG